MGRLPYARRHQRWDVWREADLTAVLEARAAGRTLAEIGAQFGGLSKERIRQVLATAQRDPFWHAVAVAAWWQHHWTPRLLSPVRRSTA